MGDIYKTVSCQFYDEIEALAVKKIKSLILYMDNENEKSVEGIIVDFKTKNKEEFLILSDGTQIRLDKILKINEINLSNNKC